MVSPKVADWLTEPEVATTVRVELPAGEPEYL
jgi:hypothetical protein